MLVKVPTAAIQGIHSIEVMTEVNASRGVMYYLVGLPDNSVKESHERIVAAIQNSGFDFPVRSITISLTPADVKKEGSAYDLPIAVGILATSNDIQPNHLMRYMFIGELSLDGTLLPVRGALATAMLAREKGYEGIILPLDNVQEAAVVNGLKVYGARTLSEVADLLNGSPNAIQPTAFDIEETFIEQSLHCEIDFHDVKGQENVKRAMEVAAAGGHNILMVGPPGSGKSMIAKRLPTILPPLTFNESLETTKIYSVAGKLGKKKGLVMERPFRSPHHTISQVALVGGGQHPMPGEISLAHNGVLYCDELPEFSRSVLEVLRQPLEDREIHISRAQYAVTYPTSFMFCASMNPCPCGYYGDPTHHCVCTPGQVMRYLNKISGPLLDRIDIHCEIQPVPFKDISRQQPGEPSAHVRQRVMAARKVQTARYKESKLIHCNAQMTDRMIQQYCRLDEKTMTLLQAAMERLNLSARAYSRILKVARTIADLEGKENIEMHHVAEAVSYRSLDRGDWAER
ncbi:MAG: YifB family Mg chelatase-like AAA ATPase [Bacteroidaceae bacterium]|nr:YifB family Mg chelatase-like AAA ATPase [Prevotellaceae bacterium]MDY5632106.1 YifB family Mg chelatase-like AAA ATPase [Bacteroidaceae bacterium]